MVLRFALVDSIEPIAIIRFVFRRRWRHEVAFIIFFTERPGQILPDQINLAGADEDIVPGPLLKSIQGCQCVGARVERGVNHRIEAVGTNCFLQILTAAPVAIDTLYPRW